MQRLQNLPIKRKLTVISMVTSGVALLLTCATFMVYEQFTVRRHIIDDLKTTAEMIGFNSASSLSFRDDDSAVLTLKSLATQPHVIRGCIYDTEGKVFATYLRNPRPSVTWPAVRGTNATLNRDSLELFHSIQFSGETIGTVYIESDLGELHERWWTYIIITGGVLLAALLLTWVISTRLQRIISEPIARLAAIAGMVGAQKNYALRAIKGGDDEIGRLIDGFNDMLAQIQARDAELNAAHKDLEQRVEARTQDLRASEERIRLIVDTAFDAIVTTDADNRIIAWNHQAETTFGWTQDEAIGRDFYEMIIAPIDRDASRHRVRRFLDSKDKEALNKRLELTALHKEGRELPVEFALSPVEVDGTILFSAFIRDITEAKRAEAELRQIHRQLLDTSRQAGMAEVATGVLHNVGNVLNSVNVSATLVADQVRRSKAPNVGKLRDLLDQHRDDLGRYLTEDPKGKIIPTYLGTLADALATEQKTIITELENLHKNIGHIKDIVAMQQSYAKTSGVVETVSVPDLVEDALRMNAGSLARHDVDISREYDGRPVITVEKNKVLQIIVNLVRNAKYACDESGRIDKLITLRTGVEESGVTISVIDNGVGIPPENLTRIFAHGFTTRKEGHGFGLHSGALAAKELGGTLAVHSDGPGKGARFTLKLPFSPGADQT
ncbi:MAG: sensor signal transduction histidine kinase [Rariglobus sp.]|jgi:PAS domain S-box-containing protein|nr:sensor signal transduction histidine kinase [Rariglobus sp.]